MFGALSLVAVCTGSHNAVFGYLLSGLHRRTDLNNLCPYTSAGVTQARAAETQAAGCRETGKWQEVVRVPDPLQTAQLYLSAPRTPAIARMLAFIDTASLWEEY